MLARAVRGVAPLQAPAKQDRASAQPAWRGPDSWMKEECFPLMVFHSNLLIHPESEVGYL